MSKYIDVTIESLMVALPQEWRWYHCIHQSDLAASVCRRSAL